MAQNKLVAIEICLAEGKPEARGQTPAGLRQERTIWTAWQAPGFPVWLQALFPWVERGLPVGGTAALRQIDLFHRHLPRLGDSLVLAYCTAWRALSCWAGPLTCLHIRRRGKLTAPGRQERTIWTACEAPGRQERINWTAWEAPGRQERTAWEPGKQERTRTTGTAWEAPGRHLGGTREAGKDYWDSLGGTREAPGRQERTSWTVWEAPGRQERTIWIAWEARGRHQGGRKGLTGQPARHQGGRKGTGSSLPLSPVRSQNGV